MNLLQVTLCLLILLCRTNAIAQVNHQPIHGKMISFFDGFSYLPLHDTTGSKIYFAFDQSSKLYHPDANSDFLIELNPSSSAPLRSISFKENRALDWWMYGGGSDPTIRYIISILNDSTALFTISNRGTTPETAFSYLLNTLNGSIDTLRMGGEQVTVPYDNFYRDRKHFYGRRTGIGYDIGNINGSYISFTDSISKKIAKSNIFRPNEKLSNIEFIDFEIKDSTMLFAANFMFDNGDSISKACKYFYHSTLLRLTSQGNVVDVLRNDSILSFNCAQRIISLNSSKGVSTFFLKDHSNRNIFPWQWEHYAAYYSLLSLDGKSSLYKCRDEKDKPIEYAILQHCLTSRHAMSSNYMFFCPNASRLSEHKPPFANWKTVQSFSLNNSIISQKKSDINFITYPLGTTNFDCVRVISKWDHTGKRLWVDSLKSINTIDIMRPTALANDVLLAEADIDFHDDAFVLGGPVQPLTIDYKKFLPLKTNNKNGYGIKTVLIVDEDIREKSKQLQTQNKITLELIRNQPEYFIREYKISNDKSDFGTVYVTYMETIPDTAKPTDKLFYMMVNGYLSVYDPLNEGVMYNDNTISTDVKNFESFVQLSLAKFYSLNYGINQINFK